MQTHDIASCGRELVPASLFSDLLILESLNRGSLLLIAVIRVFGSESGVL